MTNWKDEYFNLIFSKDSNEHDFERARILKDSNIPSKIYKYQGINEYSLRNFHANELFFRNAADFNDPYDSAVTAHKINYLPENQVDDLAAVLAKSAQIPFFDVKMYLTKHPLDEALTLIAKNTKLPLNQNEKNLLLAALLAKLQKANDKFLKGISNIYQQKIYATCFSENPTSMLMWSHYADNHKGMILEYDLNELKSEEFLGLFNNTYPVFYTDNLLSVDQPDNIKENFFTGNLAAICKSSEWRYEHEWRVLFNTSEHKEGLVIPFAKPTRIILGARTDKVKKVFLSVEAKQRGIPINEIKLNRYQYKLDIVDLEL